MAKELGLEAKALMEFLESIGEYARSSASNIEEPVARTVRAAFAEQSAPKAPEPKPKLTPKQTPVPRPNGLSAPRGRAHRENNPYVLPQERPRDQDQVLLRSREVNEALKKKAEQRYTIANADSAVDDYSPALAFRPSSTFERPEWLVRGISDAERDVWLSQGLKPDQARIAAECVEAGMQPSDLASEIDGFTILYRVTHGEPPEGVVEKWRRGIG